MKCINRSTTLLVRLAAGAVLCARAFAAASECVAVAGDRILLRDLATVLPAEAITDPERAVGFSPRAGVQRTLLFREWAGGARAPLPGEPDEICVQRASRELTRDELTAALESAFAQSGPGLTVDVQEFPKGPLPVGRLVFSRANLQLARPSPQSGLVQIIGYIEFGGDPARSQRLPIWVRARIEANTARLELTCAVQTGDEIAAACIERKQARAYPFLQGSIATPLAELTGRIARRRLAPGTVLQDNMLYPRQDVKPRQEVSLHVRCGQANLRLKATSETGGATGELVTVRLAASNRRLRARVTAPGATEYLVSPDATLESPTKGI
jgi:flagella basal body P-ring formation protein FlgA